MPKHCKEEVEKLKSEQEDKKEAKGKGIIGDIKKGVGVTGDSSAAKGPNDK